MPENEKPSKARFISLSRELLPWSKPRADMETDVRYSEDELIALLILLTNCNYKGECLFSSKSILAKYLGRKPTRMECYGFSASVKSLSNRAYEGDRIAVFANGDMDALKPSDSLNVVVKYDFSKRYQKGVYFTNIYYDEIEKVFEASKAYSKIFSLMMCMFIFIKSHMKSIEYVDKDDGEQKIGYTTFISRGTISKAIGISNRTVDSYVKVMATKGIIGFKSGRRGRTPNSYTVPCNRWLIEEAERVNTETLKEVFGYAPKRESPVRTWYGGSC